MDAGTQLATRWIDETFPDRDSIGTAELRERERGSGLPQYVRRVFDKLPDGTYTKDELKSGFEELMRRSFHPIGGSAGGMDAGSSAWSGGEHVGGPPAEYGGDEGSKDL